MAGNFAGAGLNPDTVADRSGVVAVHYLRRVWSVCSFQRDGHCNFVSWRRLDFRGDFFDRRDEHSARRVDQALAFSLACRAGYSRSVDAASLENASRATLPFYEAAFFTRT